MPESLGGLQTLTIFMQVEHGRGRHAKELHVMAFDEMLKVNTVELLFTESNVNESSIRG
jgi:hypothetical protein